MPISDYVVKFCVLLIAYSQSSNLVLTGRTYANLSDGSYIFLVQSVTLTGVLGPETETDFAVDTTGAVFTNITAIVGCGDPLHSSCAAASDLPWCPLRGAAMHLSSVFQRKCQAATLI